MQISYILGPESVSGREDFMIEMLSPYFLTTNWALELMRHLLLLTPEITNESKMKMIHNYLLNLFKTKLIFTVSDASSSRNA